MNNFWNPRYRMSGVVSSTLSIVYPPLPSASVGGIASGVVAEVQPGATAYFSSLGGAVITSALTGKGFPLPQDTNLNNLNYMPALLSSGISSIGGYGVYTQPVVKVPYLNNATINPAFQH